MSARTELTFKEVLDGYNISEAEAKSIFESFGLPATPTTSIKISILKELVKVIVVPTDKKDTANQKCYSWYRLGGLPVVLPYGSEKWVMKKEAEMMRRCAVPIVGAERIVKNNDAKESINLSIKRRFSVTEILSLDVLKKGTAQK